MPRPSERFLRSSLVAAFVAWLGLGGWLLFRGLGPDPLFGFSDRVGHTVVFAGVSLPLWTLVERWPARAHAAIAAGLLGVGILVEVGQEAFTTTRQGQVHDVVWDAVGIALGFLVVSSFRMMCRRDRRCVLVLGGTAAWLTALGVVGTVTLAPGPDSDLERCADVDALTASEGRPLVAYDFRDVPSLETAGGPPDLTAESPPVALDERGLVLDGTGRVLGDGAPITCRLTTTGEFTIVVWLSVTDIDQTGPRRVVAISEGPEFRDTSVHLGVEGDGISVRLRHGFDVLSEVVTDRLRPDAPTQVALRLAQDVLSLWVDGRPVWSQPVSGDLALWRVDRPLVIGNDAPGTDRGLRGTIATLDIWDRGLDDSTLEEIDDDD